MQLNKKDMFGDATYNGRDNAGNFTYVPKWAKSLFSDSNTYKTEFDMSSVRGKALALEVCFPFAMVIDRCGRMMQNGRYYVTDQNGNEKRSYKDIVALLNKPNMFQSGKAFLKNVEINLKCFGFCPIFTLRSTRKDLPATMVVIPPELFHIEGTGKYFYQSGINDVFRRVYIQWGNMEIDLQAEDYFIIYDSIINVPSQPGGEFHFHTPVDSLSPHTRNYMSQLIGRGNLIVNGGPKGILYGNDTTDTGNAALTPKEADEMNAAFKKKYGIVNKLYEIMVTNKKIGWITIGSNTQQMMLHEENAACLDDIVNAFGLQPDLFNESAKYDNKESAKRSAYQDLIIPDSENIAQTLTENICPEGVLIKLDFTHISCLQEDMSKLSSALKNAADSVSALYEGRLITFDEARSELSKYVDIDPENPKGEFKEPDNLEDTNKTEETNGGEQIQE